jgi:hypothetical protein
MPQIRCPNCGLTINLENRKETDMDLITQAMQTKEKTFTELLRITKLSRKTLSLRLKELRSNGNIVKSNGAYSLNGASYPRSGGKNLMKSFSRTFQDRRVRAVMWTLMFLLSSSVSGYVLAVMFAAQQPSPIHETPTVMGTFTMALDVNNVRDLHGWQTLVIYDPSKLGVLQIVPGGFVGATYPSAVMTDVSEGIFMNATDIGEGEFLVSGLLIGNGPGRDGSGRLATIIFEYYTNDYEFPSIAMDASTSETCLLSSVNSIIPIEGQTTLTFQAIG